MSQEQIAKAIEASGALPSNGNDQQDRQAALALAAVLAPLFAEAQAEALREAADRVRVHNDHIQPGGDGYSAGFHYALYCIESRAAHIEIDGRALLAGTDD